MTPMERIDAEDQHNAGWNMDHGTQYHRDHMPGRFASLRCSNKAAASSPFSNWVSCHGDSWQCLGHAAVATVAPVGRLSRMAAWRMSPYPAMQLTDHLLSWYHELQPSTSLASLRLDQKDRDCDNQLRGVVRCSHRHMHLSKYTAYNDICLLHQGQKGVKGRGGV
jgi:hypothetical protein